MKLIVEAGGNKTHIGLVDNGSIHQLAESEGINLARESDKSLPNKIMSWKSIIQGHSVSNIFYFGAGASNPKLKKEFEKVAHEVLGEDIDIMVDSDLMAACYACNGDTEGIVGILGTGSNSCYYNGREISLQVSSGGFILGDEGSGAFMGKVLLKDWLRNSIPVEEKSLIQEAFSLSNESILQNLYGSHLTSTSAYLSQFGLFLHQHKKFPYFRNLINYCLKEYFNLLSSNYSGWSSSVSLTGSIAKGFEVEIEQIAKAEGLTISIIVNPPIHRLIDYLIPKYQL